MKSVNTEIIEESIIIKQVEKICSSNDFRTKELLCRFLSYIISEHLAGRGDNLKGYTIALDVFKRDEDFDPGQDALVRINAGRLRRILDLYYLKEGKNDRIKIEIPKGGYNPKISVRKNVDIIPEENAVQKQKERFGMEPGIAVLSFANRTGQPENDYLAQGISEELSVELTKYEDLSVYNFNLLTPEKSESRNLKKLAKKRGVRFVVEGAIQKSDTQIKTLVRLVDLKDEKQIWAQSYTRELNMNNLFEIQETISKEIASIIGSEFGIIPQKLSGEFSGKEYPDIHVYYAVLKYYHFQLHLSQKTGEEAVEALLKAHAREPESAVVKALLGAFYGNSYSLDFPGADESYKWLAEYTEHAFVLKPDSLIVNATLAYKCFLYNEKERFFQLAEKCLSTGLNTTLRLGAMAFYTCLYGDWEKGKKILDKVIARNVGYPLYFHGATLLYYYRKEEYNRALNEARKYNVPAVFWSPMLRAAVYGQLGNMEMASLNVCELLKLKPDFASKAKQLIHIFVKEENLVNHIMQGLRLSGMKL